MASKKDYQAVASIIYRARFEYLGLMGGSGLVAVADRIAVDLADMFKADNGRFDRARFMEACETGTTRGMRPVDGSRVEA